MDEVQGALCHIFGNKVGVSLNRGMGNTEIGNWKSEIVPILCR